MTQEQINNLQTEFGTQTAALVEKQIKAAEERINAKAQELNAGRMTQSEFDAFKTESIAPINELMAKLESAVKEQGNKINAVLEKGAPNSISLEQFIESKKDLINELRGNGKCVEFTGAELKAAGVYSIGGSIDPASPYAPGISGNALEVFDIRRNPDFVLSRVDLGRTNFARLAWINETSLQGSATIVTEGATKPLTQHVFSVETSVAKKVAAHIELTDEFEQDLPYLATQVRRMLSQDVYRAFDDFIQTAMQLAARPYQITQLDNQIQSAKYWDALYAMMGQVGYYNFMPRDVAINWLTNVMLQTDKNLEDAYLLPPFKDEIKPAYANKLDVRHALVGEFTQYKVDIYKDFVLKIGWINDNFIQNKFCIVGEIRFHNYISEARRNALVYDALGSVAAQIDGTPTPYSS